MLKQIGEDSKAVEGLIWLIVKDYYDQLSLANKSHQELVREIGKCYKLVISERVIHRLLNHLPSDNITSRVEKFIKHHHEALREKIIDAISLTSEEINIAAEGKDEGTKASHRIARSVDDDSLSISSSASTTHSPISNIMKVISTISDWCQDKAATILDQGSRQQAVTSQLDNGLPTKSTSTFDAVDYSVFNLNSSLTLLDVIVRKFTKVKPCTTKEEPCNLLAIQGQVLNIITGFEQILAEASEEHNISMSELEVDPITLATKLTGELINGSYANIATILFASISNSNTTFSQSEFGNYLQDKIAEMLEKYQASLLLNQQLANDKDKQDKDKQQVNEDAASCSDLYSMAEFYNADIIGYCPTAQIDHQQNINLIGCGG